LNVAQGKKENSLWGGGGGGVNLDVKAEKEGMVGRSGRNAWSWGVGQNNSGVRFQGFSFQRNEAFRGRSRGRSKLQKEKWVKTGKKEKCKS